MDLPTTYKKNKKAEKWSEDASEVSFKRDFFIVALGLVLILLAFLLFGVVSGLRLDKGFPLSGKVVIDEAGDLVNTGDSKIAPELAKSYIQTGIILGMVVFIVFIGVLIVMRWMKKEDFSQKGP